MMSASDPRPTLRSLDRPRGEATLSLILGDGHVRLEGLDDELAAAIQRRWGAFGVAAPGGSPWLTLRLFRGGQTTWIERWKALERYRLEHLGQGVVASYHFALMSESRPETAESGQVWRAAITDLPDEPLERIVENLVRFACARLAVEQGGFALHGAGVLRSGRAYVVAGPSRAGKTTAVRLLAPFTSLGDDFAWIVPRDGEWRMPPLPFDNRERIDHDPPLGLWPVAGIWRLHQAGQSTPNRVERPSRLLGATSLMSCAAFPWAMPDLAERLLDQVREFVGQGHFAHLHFRKGSDLWTALLDAAH